MPDEVHIDEALVRMTARYLKQKALIRELWVKLNEAEQRLRDMEKESDKLLKDEDWEELE